MEAVLIILSALLATGIIVAVLKSKKVSEADKQELKKSAVDTALAIEKEAVVLATPAVKEIVAEVKVKAKKVATKKIAEIEKEVIDSIEKVSTPKAKTPSKKK